MGSEQRCCKRCTVNTDQNSIKKIKRTALFASLSLSLSLSVSLSLSLSLHQRLWFAGQVRFSINSFFSSSCNKFTVLYCRGDLSPSFHTPDRLVPKANQLSSREERAFKSHFDLCGLKISMWLVVSLIGQIAIESYTLGISCNLNCSSHTSKLYMLILAFNYIYISLANVFVQIHFCWVKWTENVLYLYSPFPVLSTQFPPLGSIEYFWSDFWTTQSTLE